MNSLESEPLRCSERGCCAGMYTSGHSPLEPTGANYQVAPNGDKYYPTFNEVQKKWYELIDAETEMEHLEKYINDMFLMVWRDATAGLGAEKHVVCNSASKLVMGKVAKYIKEGSL